MRRHASRRVSPGPKQRKARKLRKSCTAERKTSVSAPGTWKKTSIHRLSPVACHAAKTTTALTRYNDVGMMMRRDQRYSEPRFRPQLSPTHWGKTERTLIDSHNCVVDNAGG